MLIYLERSWNRHLDMKCSCFNEIDIWRRNVQLHACTVLMKYTNIWKWNVHAFHVCFSTVIYMYVKFYIIPYNVQCAADWTKSYKHAFCIANDKVGLLFGNCTLRCIKQICPIQNRSKTRVVASSLETLNVASVPDLCAPDVGVWEFWSDFCLKVLEGFFHKVKSPALLGLWGLYVPPVPGFIHVCFHAGQGTLKPLPLVNKLLLWHFV